MKTTKRNYEALFIVDATLTDEQVTPIIEKFSKIVTDQGGEYIAGGKWDTRRLAYEVKGRREGTYLLLYFAGEPEVAKEVERNMRISDDVLRHMIVNVEPKYLDPTRFLRAGTEEAEPETEEVSGEAAGDQAEAETPETQEEAAAEEPEESAAEAETPVESPAEAEEAPADEAVETGTQAEEAAAEKEPPAETQEGEAEAEEKKETE